MEQGPLSVLVVDQNPARAAIIEAGVREAGHSRVTVMHEVTGLARQIAVIAPDVIVINLENPDAICWKALFPADPLGQPADCHVCRSVRPLGHGGGH